MTLTDPRPHAEPLTPSRPRPAPRTPLVEQLRHGTPYAVVFGGQGGPWLDTLEHLVRTHALEDWLRQVTEAARERLAPVRPDLLRAGAEFDPVRWLAERTPDTEAATSAADGPHVAEVVWSVPGILLAQAAAVRALRDLGLDPTATPPVAVAGHSQGVLATSLLIDTGIDAVAERLAVAQLVGAATQVVARRRGLLGDCLLAISGAPTERIRQVVDALPDSLRLHVGLRNGRTRTGVSGPETSLSALVARLDELAGQEAADRAAKRTGGAPFAVDVERTPIRAAFHHPGLAEVPDLVRDLAAPCGLDADAAADLARRAVVDDVDWVAQIEAVAASDATWLLDLGPTDLATRLSAGTLRGTGIGLVPVTTADGTAALTRAGAAPRRPRRWTDFTPRAVTLPDGSTRLETRFTRLTGRSPVLLAGMTPTTVDAGIVAAAANAGFWAELAGGGQVTEEIFTARVAELEHLLDDGATWQFNTLLLDPYLWQLQVGGKRLLQRARAAGAAVDGLVVSAGIPEPEDAVRLLAEMDGVGIAHVAFKPGTRAQVQQVLAIADAVAPRPVIAHVEGGHAGGHHSWEDLEELLLATYARIREHDNVVLCVGGGIGTPERAADYLTGSWAHTHGHPTMPVDGILVGTAAMATLEATTSPAVKQLLVDTPGVDVRDAGGWVGTGRVAGGITSGRSQLGADIHEVDNAAARTGRLLDEVAGDAEAVAARHDEIVAALAATAKPYFGDVALMTYGAVLARFVELTGTPAWGDVTWRDRFHELVQRTEARLAEADHGPVPTLVPTPADVADPVDVLRRLDERHPALGEARLHPADVSFFVQVCGRPGKPVPFVPALDADVRRWYRSDSLWQAHDPRYEADQVCVIPGPVSVAGIDRVDEPVAELLRRFEDAATARVLASGDTVTPVPARRRLDIDHGPVGTVLAAPDVRWAARTVTNPAHRLGDGWVVLAPGHAEHPDTGARLLAAGPDTVLLEVPGTGLRLHLGLTAATALGGTPYVLDEAAAMRELVRTAAGGRLPDVVDGTARTTARWSADLAADHTGVTATTGTGSTAPDAVVGLAWPAIFATVSEARTGTGELVVEGMLDLVHLDHALAGDLPAEDCDLDVVATTTEVTDTDAGRVVTVEVTLVDAGSGDLVARLTERFAVRGRPGGTPLADPARAGGPEPTAGHETPRRTVASGTVTAPTDLRPFAAVSGDHNPIHTDLAAARLAGLDGPIVHGMWLSAAGQHVVGGDRVRGWTIRFLAPVRPGAPVQVTAQRVGVDAGRELVEVTLRCDDDLVATATAVLAPPVTAYVFPGQGIQHRGMGMDGYARCAAAREVWDRADRHTRQALGFSVLEVVRDNPTELVVGDRTFRHPDGVLFLTQFTQVAMAVLGSAQVAELRAAGVMVSDALIAGHSVGEYNALAAVSGVISLEAVIEVVFQRGTVMHGLVPRDDRGRSDYRLAAMRPDQCGIADDDVTSYVGRVADECGEFLQVVNLNLRGSQYAVAGTVAGLAALEARLEEARAAHGGRRCFLVIPGIDVPFHSAVLRGGVPEFRDHLDGLLPDEVDPSVLVGRYVPNLVPRPFSLEQGFVREVASYVDSGPLAAVLADWDTWQARPTRLCRILLVELLAWQFASPVRWIETQDLMFTRRELGGLGVQRLVEVGVATSPVLANLAAGTLARTAATAGDVRVLNLGRDADAVFARDEEPPAEEAHDLAPTGSSEAAPVSAPEQPLPPTPAAPAGRGDSPADLTFGSGDAVRALLALATKVRPDQLTDADTIESLCDGASSRRNQILMDLGTELSLGAIDGAAEAPLPDLTGQVATLARGYRPFGPVLQTATTDLLTGALGPAGARPTTVTDRVTGHWALGEGWARHVLVELALASRSGASVRGGDLGRDEDLAGTDDVVRAVDIAVEAVGARHGVQVAPPAAETATAVDPAALAGLTEGLTGPDGVLASTARHLLRALGHDGPIPAPDLDGDDAEVVAHLTRELGSDWVRATAPVFDARRAVLLDDRWASAREDVARIAAGHDPLGECFVGAGEQVAAHSRWWADRVAVTRPEAAARLRRIAEQAVDEAPAPYAEEVAVVTGAGRGSIAEAVVARLLAGGATVVATTSRLDHDRLRHLRRLHRRHARAGARLWVVPVNVASWTDVDAFTAWVREEQTRTVRATSVVTKPALRPTLLLPFAAGPVAGDLVSVSGRTEVDARVLLWSSHRLLAGLLEERPASANRLHVVLPGSPNRGLFGGDGAYGEMKAALDATVARWHAEPGWAERVSLVHAVIGWVRGTGLMGAHDPLAAAVEAAGVRTHTPEEMADLLLTGITPQARRDAAEAPLTLDLTGGLGDARLDLRALAGSIPAAEAADRAGSDAPTAVVHALPAPPDLGVTLPRLASWPSTGDTRPEDLVVVVGAAELGPWGSSRTRGEVEVDEELSAAGVLELAWVCGLVEWQVDGRGAGWVDTATGDPVPEHEVHDRYHDAVVERCGIREFDDEGALVEGTAPLLASVHLEQDLTFTVSGEAEARAMAEADPQRTVIEPRADGSWSVTRRAGSQVRVPRRTRLSRRVGGQLPTGFDPTAWGVPAEMVESVDRVAIWNLVCTVDAFLSSGFTPSELLRWVHPAYVANTQGTGIGGMQSMRSLYVDTLLGTATQNDILQEALPNVIAAHVAQSWVGGYGAMAHPVAACATTAVSIEEGVDKIRLGKAEFVVAGGYDDLGIEGVVGFGQMSATAETDAMRAQGIEDRHTSRANDRRHGGFVESQGGGTVLLARGDVAARAGLPVLAVVAYAASFADGLHTSIPAPGLGALAAGLGGTDSPLARGLAQVGLTGDDVAVISKHDTSTGVNERNESELHERLATALGRSPDNPLLVVSQKSLTGHAKGGAAAFQVAGLCQALASGVVPPNRSLDCVDDTLAEHRRLVWLTEPLVTEGIRAGLVTSLGFGHVAGVVALAHPEAFVATLGDEQRDAWLVAATARLREGRRRLADAMHGGDALYRRTSGRRLGDDPDRELEARLLTDPTLRLGSDGVYAVAEGGVR